MQQESATLDAQSHAAHTERIARHLATLGYGLALDTGDAISVRSAAEMGDFGILALRKKHNLNWLWTCFHLFGIWVGPRRPYIGRLYPKERTFDGAGCNRWELQIYGLAYKDELRELAKTMSVQFDTDINVRLVSELSQEESFPSDWN